MRRLFIIAIPAGLVAIAIGIVIVTTPFDLALSKVDNHYTIVGDSWRYVGNETLYIDAGNPGHQICVLQGNPENLCIGFPTRPTPITVADKYENGFGQPAYLVTADINNGNAHDIVILFNSRIDCILPDPNYPVIVQQSAYQKCVVR